MTAPQDVLTAIRTRRTIKTFTGEPIARTVVEQLVELACLAPNHRLTQPWRFAAIDRDGVGRLVELVQQPPVSSAVFARKLPMIVERLACCGAMVQVTCQRSEDPGRQAEDRDATAAAVQNLLLAAHGLGLASFWSTGLLLAHPEVLRWFGADPQREIHLGTVYLGVPEGPQPPPPRRRPLAEVMHWV